MSSGREDWSVGPEQITECCEWCHITFGFVLKGNVCIISLQGSTVIQIGGCSTSGCSVGYRWKTKTRRPVRRAMHLSECILTWITIMESTMTLRFWAYIAEFSLSHVKAERYFFRMKLWGPASFSFLFLKASILSWLPEHSSFLYSSSVCASGGGTDIYMDHSVGCFDELFFST